MSRVRNRLRTLTVGDNASEREETVDRKYGIPPPQVYMGGGWVIQPGAEAAPFPSPKKGGGAQPRDFSRSIRQSQKCLTSSGKWRSRPTDPHAPHRVGNILSKIHKEVTKGSNGLISILKCITLDAVRTHGLGPRTDCPIKDSTKSRRKVTG